MFLERCLIWVNTHYKVLDTVSKIEARKELNKHLGQAEEMVRILDGDKENQIMFEDDVTKINQALKLIEEQE